MSDDGVHPGEMPDELDAFLDDLRRAASDAPAPAAGDALTTLFREGTAPVVVAPARRRWAVRAVVAGAVAGVAFGGLGVAGALPRPVQQRVADVVDHVGVHLPDARPATTTTTVTVPPTTTIPPPSTPRPSPPTTVDDHGGGGGQGGEDHGGGNDDGSGKGSGKGTSDDAGDHADNSGRNPGGGGDVHLDEGSDHSGHDDEGRSG